MIVWHDYCSLAEDVFHDQAGRACFGVEEPLRSVRSTSVSDRDERVVQQVCHECPPETLIQSKASFQEIILRVGLLHERSLPIFLLQLPTEIGMEIPGMWNVTTIQRRTCCRSRKEHRPTLANWNSCVIPAGQYPSSPQMIQLQIYCLLVSYLR
jgi:hypothetical protein